MTRDDFLNALLAHDPPVVFPPHSELDARSRGLAQLLAKAIEGLVPPGETIEYGLQTSDELNRASSFEGEGWTGRMAWWLITNRAVLEVAVNGRAPEGQQRALTTTIATKRWPLGVLGAIHFEEVYAPKRPSPDLSVSVQLADGKPLLAVQSQTLSTRGNTRSEAVRDFAGALVRAQTPA
jgi:hypothetical protein